MHNDKYEHSMLCECIKCRASRAISKSSLIAHSPTLMKSINDLLRAIEHENGPSMSPTRVGKAYQKLCIEIGKSQKTLITSE